VGRIERHTERRSRKVFGGATVYEPLGISVSDAIAAGIVDVASIWALLRGGEIDQILIGQGIGFDPIWVDVNQVCTCAEGVAATNSLVTYRGGYVFNEEDPIIHVESSQVATAETDVNKLVMYGGGFVFNEEEVIIHFEDIQVPVTDLDVNTLVMFKGAFVFNEEELIYHS
jgi:hypothetical protein